MITGLSKYKMKQQRYQKKWWEVNPEPIQEKIYKFTWVKVENVCITKTGRSEEKLQLWGNICVYHSWRSNFTHMKSSYKTIRKQHSAEKWAMDKRAERNYQWFKWKCAHLQLLEKWKLKLLYAALFFFFDYLSNC